MCSICLLQRVKERELHAQTLSTLQMMHKQVLEDYNVRFNSTITTTTTTTTTATDNNNIPFLSHHEVINSEAALVAVSGGHRRTILLVGEIYLKPHGLLGLTEIIFHTQECCIKSLLSVFCITALSMPSVH